MEAMEREVTMAGSLIETTMDTKVPVGVDGPKIARTARIATAETAGLKLKVGRPMTTARSRLRLRNCAFWRRSFASSRGCCGDMRPRSASGQRSSSSKWATTS